MRKGVKIKVSEAYSDIFYNLLEKTKIKQKFASHSQNHYKKIFDIASEDFKVKMISAEYQNKVIVAGIVIFFANQVISLHTGSDYGFRAFKSSELKHWKTFILAKALGYKLYDFWGIDEKKFPGVTTFKKGFNGQEIEYPSAVDIVLNNNLYWAYTILRKIKYIFKSD
jgi:lipid II:glycine glycyltransferase (peptidoglycan interpeptide bridge formation enzyme)